MQIVHFFRQGYGLALAAATFAFLLTLVAGVWTERAALALYICAAVISAFFGGLRAGLLANALAVLGFVAQFQFLGPATQFRQPGDFWPNLLLLVVIGLLTAYLSSVCGRAVREAPPVAPSQRPALGPLELFQKLAAAAPAGIILLDAEGRCIFSNPACRTIAGFGLPQELDDGWTRFIHPEDQEFAAEWQAAARRQMPYATEIRFQGGDGCVRWAQLRAAPLRAEDGAYLGHLGILEDLSSWKDLEDELGRHEKLVAELRHTHQQQVREIESRLAGIQEAQGLVQYQLSEKQEAEEELRRRHARELAEWESAEERLRQENTELCLANTVLEQHLAEARNGGTLRGELERHQADWKRTEDKLRRDVAEQRKAKQAAENALAELRRTQEEWNSELQRRQEAWQSAEDKLRRQIADLTETTDLLEGELAEWQRKEQVARAEYERQLHEHDVMCEQQARDHRRFEEEREGWQQELARRDQEWRCREGSLDRVAERLQPLTQALDDAVQAWRRDSDFTAVERQSRQVRLFADALWAASRLARRELPLRREPVEVSALVERVVETASAFVQEHGQHLTVRLPLGPQWLEADPTRTEQALIALLDNAARYTEPGGQIELFAEPVLGEIVFRIKDSGQGIAPEDAPAIQSLDARERRFSEGLGLGLALVRGLTEEQRGRLEIVSEGAGCGSEFRLVLPALQEETREAPLAA